MSANDPFASDTLSEFVRSVREFRNSPQAPADYLRFAWASGRALRLGTTISFDQLFEAIEAGTETPFSDDLRVRVRIGHDPTLGP